MNTVITPVVDADTDEFLGFDFNEDLGDSVIKSLVRNNAFMPNIDRVVYNTKADVKEGELPTLATVVYFKDGTKVTVKNSDKDTIALVDETIELSDGSKTTVKTASRESREIGLIYALVKRMLCEFDEDGKVEGTGFAGFLKKTVDKAYRQDVENTKVRAEKKLAKDKAKKLAKDNTKEENPAAAKPRKVSLRDTVRSLADTLEGLKTLVQGLKKD